MVSPRGTLAALGKREEFMAEEQRSVGCGELLFAVVVTFAVGCFCGALWNSSRTQHRQYEKERNLIAPVLASDPAFARVKIHENSAGGAFLEGPVPSAKDLGQLRAKLIQVLGEPKTEFLLRAVSVESQ